LIDLQLKGGRTPDIDLLLAELLFPTGETQIAISIDGQRNVPRLVKQSLAELPVQLPLVRQDATYLVTGGLGMLGRSVAKWLIGKGAKHLVLTGRNASWEAAKELFSAVEINTAAIHVVAADIGREEDVSRLIQTIGNELPVLKGVVHSAGVLDDGILAQLDWDRFSRVFEPKVYGSWLLHEYTKSLKLDFFILKSSLLSLLGSAGQGNYTASNAFLDGLAAHRRAMGLPATAINWCAWSGGGLATLSGARGEAMWSLLGVEFISPAFAIQVFDALMNRDVDQIAIAVADWPTYADKVGKSPFLAELLDRHEISRTSRFANGKVNLDAPRTAVSSRQQLLNKLQQHFMAKLGFAEAIDPDQPLNEIGLDSLMSVSLSNSLEDEFGMPVPIAELISGPSINELVDRVFRDLDAWAKNELSLTDVWTDRDDRIGGDQYQDVGLQRVANSQALDRLAIDIAEIGNNPEACSHVGISEKTPSASRSNGVATEDFGISRPASGIGLRTVRKWLIAPRPNPDAKARLFCFPYAGGGLVSFRPWSQLLDKSIELVAVEPPGRGTRINETAIDDLDTFVECLLPEMVDWLDRPSAFFGHCVGGLTMFATLCALPRECADFVKYSFACGVKPPHLLKRRGEFEDNLAYDMMLHKEFDIRIPPYAQADEIFAGIIRQFGLPAADRMLETPKLREVLLPTIRAEFGMAYNYEYRPVVPFAFPISSFVGNLDPWVSQEDSAAWGELTCGGFTNHVRKGSHFLMADDGEYILQTINNEFVSLVVPMTRDGQSAPV
jgi:surfactin synthase thioesterase subunit/NAD(P)-dependent dehydrogenase (short-subunit alcohol dehydrogenase family)/acyl carrier protein